MARVTGEKLANARDTAKAKTFGFRRRIIVLILLFMLIQIFVAKPCNSLYIEMIRQKVLNTQTQLTVMKVYVARFCEDFY